MKNVRAIIALLRFVWLLAQLTYRFWSGRPMDGQRKTNATFRRRATRSLDESGTALKWEMLAGYERLLWRLAVSYALLLSFVLLMLSLFDLARPVLLWHVSVVGALLIARFVRQRVRDHGYRLPIPTRIEHELLPEEELLQLTAGEQIEAEKVSKHWAIRWVEKDGRLEWEKEKVLPLGRSIAAQLQVAWTEQEMRKHISIPRNYKDEGGGKVEILLPASFTGVDIGAQTRLVGTVAKKLGIKEPVASWQIEGSAPRVLIGQPPAPPKLVLFRDVRHFFEAAEPFSPFYGVIAGGEGLHIGMHSDTPHMALSAGSGAGKSEMIKVLLMQALHWGWSVVILDWKNESQEWAKGLRGVRYHSTEESIHDALIAIGDEVDARKNAPPGTKHNPIIVVCEEWSMTSDLLSEYWGALRSTAEPEERKLMPTRSPALTAAKKVVFTGRSLGLFQLLVAIRFSARVTGGNADLRESFQVILMARWKIQTQKMLAGNIKPFPANKPKEVGRWVVVAGEEATIMRAPLATDDEARDWATSGVLPPPSPFSERYRVSQGQEGSMRPTLGDHPAPEVAGDNRNGLPVLEAEVVEIQPRKLTEMVNDLQDTVDDKLTLKILRKAASDKESGFPLPVGMGAHGAYLYDPEAVRIWTRKRYATRMARSAR